MLHYADNSVYIFMPRKIKAVKSDGDLQGTENRHRVGLEAVRVQMGEKMMKMVDKAWKKYEDVRHISANTIR